MWRRGVAALRHSGGCHAYPEGHPDPIHRAVAGSGVADRRGPDLPHPAPGL